MCWDMAYIPKSFTSIIVEGCCIWFILQTTMLYNSLPWLSWFAWSRMFVQHSSWITWFVLSWCMSGYLPHHQAFASVELILLAKLSYYLLANRSYFREGRLYYTIRILDWITTIAYFLEHVSHFSVVKFCVERPILQSHLRNAVPEI